MNFKQTIDALINGKKVRRKCWEEGHYWHIKKSILLNSISKVPTINLHQISDTETWEIYDEEEKIIQVKEMISKLRKDKKAMKELNKWMEEELK